MVYLLTAELDLPPTSDGVTTEVDACLGDGVLAVSLLVVVYLLLSYILLEDDA